jgi:hypothetical protein
MFCWKFDFLFAVRNIIAIYNTANSIQFMMVFPGMLCYNSEDNL